jgi:hypothetical protein
MVNLDRGGAAVVYWDAEPLSTVGVHVPLHNDIGAREAIVKVAFGRRVVAHRIATPSLVTALARTAASLLRQRFSRPPGA